ncbi:MAG TPA: ACT domain-containing protein [Vicinamibacteria bacterium]|nr:ACT domain-containing protein [Vicinamibacteria bacterium]
MAEGSGRARLVWARTRLQIWPETYRLVSLPKSALAEAAGLLAESGGSFAALVLTSDEVSLTLPEEVWGRSPLQGRARASAGPYRVVTLDAEIDLDVCGYLAPVAARLAEAGVPIVPQCAYAKDHLLFRGPDLEGAIRVLHDWIRACRA